MRSTITWPKPGLEQCKHCCPYTHNPWSEGFHPRLFTDFLQIFDSTHNHILDVQVYNCTFADLPSILQIDTAAKFCIHKEFGHQSINFFMHHWHGLV